MQFNKVGDTELTAFVLAAQQKVGFKMGYEIKVGQRYARIFMHDYHNKGSRLFCFIDLTNGNVLRHVTAGRAPNLKVKDFIQGNVFDQHKGSGSIQGSRL